MEGDPEESDEDVQDCKPHVLWEKCIQQSIIVDLSEDESLHLSDLESSLALHLSQAESAASEASIHLSGSAELSALDDTSSESSSVSSHSVNVVETKSSMLHVSAQRPNTKQDELPLNHMYEDPGQNTSDEDQEDLPYDGDLGSPYFNQTASSEGNTGSDGRHTVQASPDLLELPQVDANTNLVEASKPCESAPLCTGLADITQLLLRHFSQDKLLQSGRLIEAETLPEMSLLESMDDTLYSLAPTQHSTGNNDNTTTGYNEENDTGSLGEETEKTSVNSQSAPVDNSTPSYASTGSNQSGGEASEDGVKLETAEEYNQDQRVPLVRARSFTEMKYGQGKVHYPLPDFSKVAPKVKVPKAPSGPVRSVPQSSSSMHRTQSSPGMLDLISRVLEDSVQPPEKPYVFKDDDKQTPPALVDHLQAEYDKLLTKYAEAENLIDQMRLGTSTQPSTDTMLYLEHGDDDENQVESAEGNHLGFLGPQLPPSENFKEKVETVLHHTIEAAKTTSSCELEDVPSDGERMTAELRDIISQFMQNVEEFRFSVSNMAVNTPDQQMMLRSMMEAQDQLERRYMSKKEEHRALEMQNYMGLSRNTGTFDPDRLVEGDIFRIGMHLEDIKEMIDKNVCEQISPPHSSSTPTAMSLHVKTSPQSMSTPSPPPALHEWPSAIFSTASHQQDSQKEEEDEEEEEEEASEIHVSSGLDQSRDLVVSEHLLNYSGRNSCQSRDSLGSLEIQTAEEEEGTEEERSSVLSEAIDHSDILAYLSGSRQWTDDSSTTPNSLPDPKGECNLGDCVSLAVEVSSSSDTPRDLDSLSEPPLNTSSVSQRIVSPETDSGFGSSYLNQSASGSSHPNLLSESLQSQNEGLSSSDSEGSCSNLQTAIHSAEPQCASPQTRHRGAAATVERWVESTTKEPSARLQAGTDQNQPVHLQHHMSQTVVSTTMNTEDRHSPVQSCSCNSEAILALQSEVSRLKKDLEEGLVQLPHLAQKMDYLTSKYRKERQGRRSKTRTHQRPACNSVGKSLSSRGLSDITSPSPVKIEDWISSDMDPSKSKGTGSGDTSCSEITLQFHSSPVGSRRGVCSAADFQYKLQQTVQSNRGALGSSSFKGDGDGASESHIKQTPQTMTKSLYSKDKWALFPTASLQKPLLQVSYGSSSSLPASYKVREPPLQSYHRKRSTQSDSALLPSNVYFQRTLSPVSRAPSRTGSRMSRHSGSKEEDMNRTLDQAIEVALSMKRTTDRMARRLSVDLAKAQQHKKLYNMQPLVGRKHQAL